MSDERTEQATGKRRQKARDEGQVSKSQDLSSAFTLSIAMTTLVAFGPTIFSKFKDILEYTLKNLNPDLINRESFISFHNFYISETMKILLPMLSIMLFSGIIINYFQTGPLFTAKAVKFDISKLSPGKIISGFKKFFNLKSAVELVKSFIKILIISSIGYSIIKKHEMEMISLLGGEAFAGIGLASGIFLEMAFKICIVLFILGMIDKKYQDYEYEKSLKMTKQEVKDERKNAEGDPKIKARIKSAQMKFATQRMMSAIPTANVVIANPTHYAIALRYDLSQAPAPQVIAKGVDFLAFKIREIAEANNVPIIENPPLARTLYKIVPLDGLIPADMYVAVAEVLAHVYKINKNRR